MMQSSLKASWWLWWGNPLVKMHPDQKKRLYIPAVGNEQLDYSDIASLRNTLGLALMPEEGVMSAPWFGAVLMCEAVDLHESKNRLPALTFDESVFKFSQAEWDARYQISDKDHIRALITFARSIPEELKPFIKKITLACTDNHPGHLSLLKRTQVVLSVFLSHRFPAFGQRWLLNLSDSMLNVINQLGKLEPSVLDQYCNLIEPEIVGLIDLILRRHEVPELDFKTLADYELEDL